MGSRAPHRFVRSDFEALERYLRTETSPGDSFYFWRFEALCTDETVTLRGKVPDAMGRVPEGGAY
jgi:hypothetical protein